MSTTGTGAGGFCSEVQERLSEVLDGAAPAAFYEHIAECDACRDLRYEAGRAAELIALAGDDVGTASGFAAELRARVMAAAQGVATPRAEAPKTGASAGASSAAPASGNRGPGSVVVLAGLSPTEPEHSTSPTVLAPLEAVKTQPSNDAVAASGPAPAPASASAPVPVPVPVNEAAPAPVPVPVKEAAPVPVPVNEPAPALAPAQPTALDTSPPAPAPVKATIPDAEPPAKAADEAHRTDPKPASAKSPPRDKPAASEPRALVEAKPINKTAAPPRRTKLIAAGVAALAVAAGGGLLLKSKLSQDDTGPSSVVVNTNGPWWGKVTSVSRASQDKAGGLEVCDAAGACSAVAAGADVRAGSTLRTDARTRAFITLTDGTELALDRGTRLSLAKDQPRTASLEEGAVVAEITAAEKAAAEGAPNAAAPKDWAPARFLLPQGEVEVLGTKLALTAGGSRASVEVARGAARVRGRSGRDVEVRAGEEATLNQGGDPELASTSSLADTMEWSDKTPEEVDAPVLRGLGELRAKKPGQTKERDRAVRLAKHAVKVRIVDVVARTEVDETFANDTDEELEGIFRFPLPPGAQIERLALEVDGKLMEGAFVDRDRGAAIWRGVIQNAAPKAPKPKEEIVWVPGPWRDPALLEWQRGGRFELRIFPIPKRGSRRVVLTYTETVGQAGGVRRFTYPLAHDPSGTTKIDAFDLDLQVLGLDKSAGISTRGYELVSASGDGERRTMHADNFIPAGDLTVEFALPDRSKEVTAWAYKMDAPPAPPASASEVEAAVKKAKAAEPKGKTPEEKAAADAAIAIASDTSPYVAIAVRPKLPRWQEAKERAFAIVVDSSRSMVGERFARATRLASSLVREMDRRDSFVLLACDTVCRPMPADTSESARSADRRGGSAQAAALSAPGAAAAANVERFLGAVEPDGGSDLAASINAARAAAGSVSGKELRILYLGDGTPTVGPTKPGHLEAAVRGSIPPGDAAVIAVGLGADADATSLSALARGGGGVFVPYVPGQKVSSAALDVLGTAYGVVLRDPEIELPAGLTQVTPARLDPIRAGGETILVARMSGGSEVSGTVKLRGRVSGERFEQTYPVKVVATSNAGNAFVPRLYAAAKIAELERVGGDLQKGAIIELSKRFAVASRYTSLLVLESEAMFKAFGLDRISQAPSFTGEALAQSSTADAEGEPEAEEAAAEAEKKEDSAFGPSPAATAAAPASRAAPAPAKKPMPMDAFDDAAPSRGPRGLGGGWSPPPPPDRGRFVPMRRVFDRNVAFEAQNTFLSQNAAKLIAAESALAQAPDSRDKTADLYALYATSGRLGEAQELTAKWSGRDALDPDALIARADLAARQGDRERAARILGGLADVRPGDRAAQTRLAKLHDAAGSPALACEHRIALADLAPSDAALVADAARCARSLGMTDLASLLVSDTTAKVREAVEKLLAAPAPATPNLAGDVQITATWSGGADVDIALIDAQGRRTSWLGSTSKASITARDVTSQRSETLAIAALPQGNYVVEISRASGEEGNIPVRGDLTLRLGNNVRTAPFTLTGPRTEVGTVRVFFTSRLVPVNFGWP